MGADQASKGAGSCRRGRRPGTQSSRGEVLAAARTLFASVGYEKTTIRAVAAEAGVDSALVVRFFNGKEGLFSAVLESLDVTLPTLLAQTTVQSLEGRGVAVARTYLEMWESPEVGPALQAMVRGAIGSPQALGLTQKYLGTGVFATPRPHLALVGGMLLGVAITRHVIASGPTAQMGLEELARMLGPSITAQLDSEHVHSAEHSQGPPGRSGGATSRQHPSTSQEKGIT